MRQFIIIAIAICLTQLASGEIGETRVPEIGGATEVIDADVIPREVRDSLHESELLQDPVHSFVETLHTSVHAAHRAAKANKEIMSADEAISALAKRAKNELKSDLDSKKMTSPQPPHRHRSRAAKRAAKKIASRSTSQQAKREARKKKFHNHKSSSNKRTFVALETKKTKGKAHGRHVQHRDMAALHTAKAAVRAAAKNRMKANKRTRHGGHAEKTKVHWARLSQSQCHSQCASANMKEFARTCKQQCAKADYACLQRCTFPMRKCKCRCSQEHLWTCSGARCGCWKLQHRDHSEVSNAMMKAENDALSKGLGHRVAKKWATDAQRKALAKAKARATTQRRLKAKKKATSLVETKKWLHTIF